MLKMQILYKRKKTFRWKLHLWVFRKEHKFSFRGKLFFKTLKELWRFNSLTFLRNYFCRKVHFLYKFILPHVILEVINNMFCVREIISYSFSSYSCISIFHIRNLYRKKSNSLNVYLSNQELNEKFREKYFWTEKFLTQSKANFL